MCMKLKAMYIVASKPGLHYYNISNGYEFYTRAPAIRCINSVITVSRS